MDSQRSTHLCNHPEASAKGTTHLHVPNAWAPDWSLRRNRKSRCWLLSTNLCLISINFRNLSALISYRSEPKAGHHRLPLAWRVLPQAQGQAASRHSSGRPVSWHPASSWPLDDWLLSTLADPPRQRIVKHVSWFRGDVVQHRACLR